MKSWLLPPLGIVVIAEFFQFRRLYARLYFVYSREEKNTYRLLTLIDMTSSTAFYSKLRI